MIRRLLFALSLLLPVGAWAACPDIGPAPRTIYVSAAAYAHSEKFSLDKDGILVFDYGENYGGLGKFRNPYFDAQYALALYRDWLNTNCRDAALKKAFFTQAEWLAQSAEIRGGMAVWPYPFENKAFQLEPGWISGIGQSRIAGVLFRAAAAGGGKKFRDLGYQAMHAYETPIAKGGVASLDGDILWTEEAADPKGHSFKVLNGHITALSGILDIYRITDDPQFKTLFERGVAAVRRDLPQFDAGFSSYYSLSSPANGRHRSAARHDYNMLHVSQLLWLYDETHEGIFLRWASRFQAYELNRDTFLAKDSVDPVNHGPDKAAAFFGNEYWSSSSFPTWIEVDAPEPTAIAGLAIYANSTNSVPRRFTVSSWNGKSWEKQFGMSGNHDLVTVARFPKPVTTDKVRLDIEEAEKHKNVALQAAMLIRDKPVSAPITNECNYRAKKDGDRMSYNYDAAIDGNPATAMQVQCKGWLLLPPKKDAARLVAAGTGGETAKFTVEASDDLEHWKTLGTLPVTSKGRNLAVPQDSWIRVSFGKETKTISRVDLLK